MATELMDAPVESPVEEQQASAEGISFRPADGISFRPASPTQAQPDQDGISFRPASLPPATAPAPAVEVAPTPPPASPAQPTAEHRGMMSKAWEWMNQPANIGNLRQSLDQAEADSNSGPRLADLDSPVHAAGTLIKHAVEGFGADAGKMLLTPLSAALTATGAVGEGASLAARAARAVGTAAGVGFGAVSAKDVAQHGIKPNATLGEKGYTDPNYVRRVLQDAAMMAGGAASAGHSVGHVTQGIADGAAAGLREGAGDVMGRPTPAAPAEPADATRTFTAAANAPAKPGWVRSSPMPEVSAQDVEIAPQAPASAAASPPSPNQGEAAPAPAPATMGETAPNEVAPSQPEGDSGQSPEQGGGQTAPALPKLETGSHVRMADGEVGQYRYYNDAMGRGRVATASGKLLPSVRGRDVTPITEDEYNRATGKVPSETQTAEMGSREPAASEARADAPEEVEHKTAPIAEPPAATTAPVRSGDATGESVGNRLEPGEVGRVKVADLTADPKRFQYKLNTDDAGATGKLKDVTWNDALSGIVTAWRDPADGKSYVVNGHHRYDLARRHGVDDLAVRMLGDDVKDAATARTVGALQNIAEGNGTPVDAAKFMRDSGMGPDELARYGVSLSDSVAEGGSALARLDQRFFDDVVAGRIPEKRGIAIGKAAETPEQQEALLKMIRKAEAKGKTVTNATIDELGRMVKDAGLVTTKQDSLFGVESRTQNTALEKAEVSAYIRQQLASEKKLFGGLTSTAKADALGTEGNRIDTVANKGVATRAEQAQEVYDRLSTRRGPVDDILNRAAKQIAEGENASAVKSQTYRDIRTALREAYAGADEGRGVSVQEDAARPAVEEAHPSEVSPSTKPTAAELAADLRARGKAVETGASLEERRPSREELEDAGQAPMFSRDPFLYGTDEEDQASLDAHRSRIDKLASEQQELSDDMQHRRIPSSVGNVRRVLDLSREIEIERKRYARQERENKYRNEVRHAPEQQALFHRGDSEYAVSRIGGGDGFESIPAQDKDAPMVHVSTFVRDTLNAIEPELDKGGQWAAATIPSGGVDKLIQRLRLHADDLRPYWKDYWHRLADTVAASRDQEGSAILLSEFGTGARGEEQMHAWQFRRGTSLGDVALQIGQHPAVLKAAKFLEKQGYTGVQRAIHEAVAKTFNGDWAGAGLNRKEGASLLSEYLDAVVRAKGKDALSDLPNLRASIADVVEEAYERHSIPVGERSRAPEGSRGETSAQPDRGESGESASGLRGWDYIGGSDGEDGGGSGPDQGTLFQRGGEGVSGERRETGDATEGRNESEPLKDLIDKIKTQPKADRSLVDRFKKESQRTVNSLKDRASDVQKGLASIKGIAAAAWDSYRRPPAWTDFKDTTGKFQAAEQFADHAMNEFAKEIKRVVPDKVRREAMSNWVEAEGNARLLKERAALTEDPALRKGYEVAAELTPEETKLAGSIREYLDTQLDRAQKAGLLEQGARNYITHIHEKDQRGLQSLINFGELAPNPAFIKKRVFSSYFEGEQQGFMPRDKDIGYLTAAYHDAFTKALASRAYIGSMLEGKASDGRPLAILGARGKWVQLGPDDAVSIIEQQKRPESVADYRTVDHPALRGWNWDLSDEEAAMVSPKLFEDSEKALAVQGDLLLHPEVAGKVSNILGKSAIAANKVGKAALIVSSTLKQSLLSFSGFHQTQEGVHALEHKVLPANMPELDFDNTKQRALVEHGLVVADFDGQSSFSEGVSGTELTRHLPLIGEALHSYQHYLFHSYIPRLKMAMAMHALDRNRLRYKGKLDDHQILEMTANQANAAFGGLNYKMMGRNKTLQDLLRLTLLAPDFLEARGRFVAQGAKPFHQEQRSALIRGALVMYASARILNYLLNDGDMKLEPEMWNKVAFKGHTWGLRTVQGDIFHLASDPRSFIFNRVNPMTTRPVIEFLTGRDQFGRQKVFTSQMKDYVKSAAPIPAQGWLNNIEETWPESIAKAMGVETGKYRTPAEQEAYRQHIANIPDSPDDPDKQDAARFHSQTEQKVRDGKMSTSDLWDLVEKGKLTPHEAGRIQRASESSKLENYTKNLTIEQAIKVYEKANPVERQLLRPTLEKKRGELANRTEEQRDAIESKLDKLLAAEDGETASK